MEDSKIIWYIVLGAIYVLSKVFKKKKKPEEQQPYNEAEEYQAEVEPEKKTPNSFDEILKELSKEIIPEESKTTPTEIEVDEIKHLVSETNPLPTYFPKSDHEIKVEKATQLPPKTFAIRDRPLYQRNEKFALVEEENEIAQDIHDFLRDVDGPKKAIILSDILNRKY
jgi:hypothetical protein